MRVLLVVLLFISPLTFARDTKPKNTTVSMILNHQGRDAEGDSVSSRFEITPDGLVKWQASSAVGTDPTCVNGGGRLQGRIENKRAHALVKLAFESLKDQKKNKPEAIAPRETTIHLTVTRGNEVKVGKIQKSNKAWKKMTAEIEKLKRQLKPTSLVIMSSKKEKNILNVRFTLLGDKATSVLLSPQANEVFKTSQGAKLTYAKKIKKSELKLDPKNRSAVVSLKTGQLKPAQTLIYSNAVVLHHADKDIPMTAGVPELRLCTTL